MTGRKIFTGFAPLPGTCWSCDRDRGFCRPCVCLERMVAAEITLGRSSKGFLLYAGESHRKHVLKVVDGLAFSLDQFVEKVC